MADQHGGRYGVRKGAWSEQEDALLRQCIEKYGEGKWHQIPLKAGLNRCRKSCRLRWLNYLKPNIKRGEFSIDEADLMIRLHRLLGNRWSLIAGRLPGRTANDVKNYWNTHLRKKIMHHHQVKSHPPHHQTKVIRPRPRTFSKRHVQFTRQQPQGQHLSADERNTAAINSRVDKSPAIVSTEDGLEQIQWWKSLLNETDEFSLQGKAVTAGLYSTDEILPVFEERANDQAELSFDIGPWDFLAEEWFIQQ